jgi:hypothetical protein
MDHLGLTGHSAAVGEEQEPALACVARLDVSGCICNRGDLAVPRTEARRPNVLTAVSDLTIEVAAKASCVGAGARHPLVAHAIVRVPMTIASAFGRERSQRLVDSSPSDFGTLGARVLEANGAAEREVPATDGHEHIEPGDRRFNPRARCRASDCENSPELVPEDVITDSHPHGLRSSVFGERRAFVLKTQARPDRSSAMSR